MNYAIFDLDGTLLDSMWVWDNIDVEFLKIYGYIPSQEMREQIKTMSFRQSSELYKKTFSLTQSVEEMMDEMGRMGASKYQTEVMLKPDVLMFLQKLKQENVKMCIATASSRTNALCALQKNNILDFFEFVISSSDVKTGKDDPEIFLLCAEKLGAEPQNIVVFEDALHAIETAKSAGFQVVAVYDRSAEDDIEEIKKISDAYVNRFGELEEFF